MPLESCSEPCWCPFALIKSFWMGGEYCFSAFHVVVVKQLWCCQSDFISHSCLLEIPFNKLSHFCVVTLFEVKQDSSRFLGFHCSCRDAQFSSVMVTDARGIGSCSSRWFLLLCTEPKAVAPHAGSLTSSSMEQPVTVIWYFGLSFVVCLLSLSGRSWNLPLINLAACLLLILLVCCCQPCCSLAMHGGSSTQSSWSDQAPHLCCLVRWSFVLISF